MSTQHRRQQRGGSVASDSVTSLVDAKTFDRMNTMFTNKVGGCGCNKKSGGSFGSLMGSRTMEAFYNNVKPPVVALNSAPQLLPVTTPNASKPANAKSSNSTKVPNAAKPSNAGNTTKSVNVKASNTANTSAKTGGGMANLFDIMGLNSGKTMAIRHRSQRQQGGWAEQTIGQKINMQSMSHNPRQAMNVSAVSVLASESVNGPMPIQKATNFGSTSDSRSLPFSFGAASAASGGAGTWRKKAMQKLKTLEKSKPKSKSSPNKK